MLSLLHITEGGGGSGSGGDDRDEENVNDGRGPMKTAEATGQKVERKYTC